MPLSKKYALIMAAGVGRRAGYDLPKQFHKLLGIPMLWWSVLAFYREDPSTRIIVVMHPDFFQLFNDSRISLPDYIRNIPVQLVPGGASRAESVANGLNIIEDSSSAFVAVHDAARPLISVNVISDGWNCACFNSCAVPVIDVTDSLREVNRNSSHAIDRSKFKIVQTPQIVRADILKRAYNIDQRPEFTDDASRVEALGCEVTLFNGSPLNFKVTNPNDFTIAEALLTQYGYPG